MKKLLTFVLLMPFYLSAADFGVGYSHFNIDLGDGDSVGLGTVTAAIGAKSEVGRNHQTVYGSFCVYRAQRGNG